MSEQPALRPNTDIGPSLAAIARAAIADATRDADGQSEAELIHDVRQAMKRWRALLRLFEPILGEEGVRLRHEARDLARRLAGARDAQAAIDAIDDLGEDYAALSPRSLATVKARIEELRTTAETATHTSGAHERLRAALTQTADAIDQWPLDKVDFHDLAESLTEGYRRARLAIPDDWTSRRRSPARVAPARRGASLPDGNRRTAVAAFHEVWVGETQRLRDRLGQHQDLAVLSRLTAALSRWRAGAHGSVQALQRARRITSRMRCATPDGCSRKGRMRSGAGWRLCGSRAS